MTTKKIPLMCDTRIDWLRIGQIIGLLFIGILTALNHYNFNRVEKKVDSTAVVVQQVKRQTDGTITASKKVIAIAAENLAASTKSAKDMKAAKEAWEDYESQVNVQRKAEEERDRMTEIKNP